jgi:hypothetical protein
MVPDIELFSIGSEGPNILATWAFNKRDRDGIRVVPVPVATLPKRCKGEKP